MRVSLVLREILPAGLSWAIKPERRAKKQSAISQLARGRRRSICLHRHFLFDFLNLLWSASVWARLLAPETIGRILIVAGPLFKMGEVHGDFIKPS